MRNAQPDLNMTKLLWALIDVFQNESHLQIRRTVLLIVKKKEFKMRWNSERCE